MRKIITIGLVVLVVAGVFYAIGEAGRLRRLTIFGIVFLSVGLSGIL